MQVLFYSGKKISNRLKKYLVNAPKKAQFVVLLNIRSTPVNRGAVIPDGLILLVPLSICMPK